MKKLMFVAAAAMACSAFCIESANTVGYMSVATEAGFNFFAPMFKNTSGAAVDIQAIVLDPTTATSWADNIQVFEEGSGEVIASYYYATKDESGLTTDGWLNSAGTDLATYAIKPGQCFAIETAQESQITNAGEVNADDTEFTATAGFVFIGNISPVDISVQDVVIDPLTATSWTDNIQLFEAGSGEVIASYYYATKDESGLTEDGWLNSAGTDLADATIHAGEGFAVETANDAVTITLPSAL